MAKENFSKCMSRVLAYEGGYSNHPSDPGGVTLEGVTQRVYDGYRQRKGLKARPLTAAMRSTAAWQHERDEIYRLQYWEKVRGDELPAGIDLVVFDGAVNSGPVQSIKWLQRALGVTADGMIGEVTLTAIDACLDDDLLIDDICRRRMGFLRSLKTWSTFGTGWSRRVANVLETGQAWATGSVGPAPVEICPTAKAEEQDIAGAPVSVGAGATATTSGTVVAGLLDPLQQASVALQPLAGGIAIAKYAVLGLTLIIAGLTLYGIYRNWRAEQARSGEAVAALPGAA